MEEGAFGSSTGACFSSSSASSIWGSGSGSSLGADGLDPETLLWVSDRTDEVSGTRS